MSLPAQPSNEANRLQELRDLQLLNTTAEPAFDNLDSWPVRLANPPLRLNTHLVSYLLGICCRQFQSDHFLQLVPILN